MNDSHTSPKWRRWMPDVREPKRRIRVNRVTAEATSTAAGTLDRRRGGRASLARPSISVFGEEFEIEAAGGVIWLTHPRWSLVGSGRTLVAAQMDLLEEARELAEAVLGMDVKTMSPRSLALRDYLLTHFV